MNEDKSVALPQEIIINTFEKVNDDLFIFHHNASFINETNDDSPDYLVGFVFYTKAVVIQQPEYELQIRLKYRISKALDKYSVLDEIVLIYIKALIQHNNVLRKYNEGDFWVNTFNRINYDSIIGEIKSSLKFQF